ncbi:MAG: DJ-1/PfpI family protein [Clostridia bacterium]|nr:DJ-1/PfpI family protein [Clostridia bacterium]
MVYVILAEGFEEIEALTPVDVLLRAGAEVKTVGITGRCVTGAHGISVKCDLYAAEDTVDMDSCEMLVFPGGMPGAENIDKYPATDSYIDSVISNGGYVGAICAAPMILGKRGYLKDRRAVCYPGFEEYLTGAKVCDADAVRDGQFITSRCMGTALDFALELTQCLFGEKKRLAVEAAVNGRA